MCFFSCSLFSLFLASSASLASSSSRCLCSLKRIASSSFSFLSCSSLASSSNFRSLFLSLSSCSLMISFLVFGIKCKVSPQNLHLVAFVFTSSLQKGHCVFSCVSQIGQNSKSFSISSAQKGHLTRLLFMPKSY